MPQLWHPETGAFIDVSDDAAVHHHRSGWMLAADREAWLADQAARTEAPKPSKKSTTEGGA